MRIGQLLGGRFMLERLAGRGGMGEVYRALDRDTGQTVALKVLHGQGGDVARFEREARILAGLDHPLVVRYVAHGALATGEPYLAMEWLDGEDLAVRLACHRPDVAESVALATRVAESLAVLHEHGIVHRDLKPSNVFLVDGRLDAIKLLDFGLARIDTGTRMTDAGTLLGTVAYMAPEQARGADGLDARADVFALGCLLFECLTGQTPFAAVHATAVLTKILFEDTPRLRQRLPGAPDALDALLGRMLSKQPHERPRDGGAAAEALRALGTPKLVPVLVEDTVELPRTPAITDSEQRAVAVLLIAAPATAAPVAHGATLAGAEPCEDIDALGVVASEHGGRLQWLLDGSAAVLVSGTQVATDLATQAARCALALGRYAAGRRIALALGRSELAGPQPVGPAIDRAARLLGIEPAPESNVQRALILLDDLTVGLLDPRFNVRGESGIAVLVDERDVAEVRTLLGKPTPCVGRERELRQLEQLFEDCVEDSAAQVVLVTASPGVGKSRLGREFIQRIRNRGGLTAIWIARGDMLRAGSPLGLLTDLVHSACGLRAGEPPDVRRDRLSEHVAKRIARSEQQRVAEFLGEIIGATFPDEHSPSLRAARRDAQLMSDQIRAAFLHLLTAECTAQPVLIVLEDLHWGDGSTVRLLDRALRELGDQPLFVLAMARPEVHQVFPQLWAERQWQEIRLKTLPRKAIEQLVRHVLEDRALPETIDALARLSEGNAFYLEELIRWAAEGREGELPQTVVAMVQSRLGALDDESRRVLRAASIFGETFWAGGAAALLGGRERTMPVRACLSQLVEQEFCLKRQESRFPGEEEYAFRHALVREGAYSMLADEDFVLGHRVAAEWLEERGEHDPLVLAEHFEKGRERLRAAGHYLRAADIAFRGGDPEAAIDHARRGLDCNAPGEVRIGLLGLLCEASIWSVANFAAGVAYADELLQTVPHGSAPWFLARIFKLTYAAQVGNANEFADPLHELLGAKIQPNALESAVLAISIGSVLLEQSGKVSEGKALFDEMEMLVESVAEPISLPSVLCDFNMTLRAAYVVEDPWMGLLRGRRGIDRCTVIGHERYLLSGKICMVLNAWLLGAYDDSRRLSREVHVPDEQFGLISSIRPVTLAWMLADLGSLDEARQWAERLIVSSRARRALLDEGRGRWALGEVLRRGRELEMAEREIHAALALLTVACPLDYPGVLATLAALRLDQGRSAEALAAAENGLARYESMGACSLFFRGAFLRLVHAECLEATGAHEAARTAIARAREWLFVIADKIGDPAYRKSFLENVPENRRTIELARQWLGEDA